MFLQTCSMQVEYPANFPDASQTTPDTFEHEARVAMVVTLFEMKRFSSGMATQLAGIDRVSFLMELSKYDVPMCHKTTVVHGQI